MKKLAGLFGFVVWAALILNGRPSEATTPKPRLVLTWIDPNGLVPFGSAVRSDVENLFEDIDCDVRWGQEGRSDLQSGEVGLRVILMPSKPAGWSLSPHGMGVVFANEVTSSRTVYIFSPTIARGLGYGPQRVSRPNLPPRERRLLARAFSRVIAHEVFHAIAPSLPHATDGLTSPALDRNFLARPKTSINANSAAVFCQELAKLAAVVVARETLPEAE